MLTEIALGTSPIKEGIGIVPSQLNDPVIILGVRLVLVELIANYLSVVVGAGIFQMHLDDRYIIHLR